MLLTVNKRMSCTTSVKNNNLSKRNIFSVSNEMSSILVTLFLGDESGKVCQKTFVSLSKNSGRKEKDRKAAAKLLAIQANKQIYRLIKIGF